MCISRFFKRLPIKIYFNMFNCPCISPFRYEKAKIMTICLCLISLLLQKEAAEDSLFRSQHRTPTRKHDVQTSRDFIALTLRLKVHERDFSPYLPQREILFRGSQIVFLYDVMRSEFLRSSKPSTRICIASS